MVHINFQEAPRFSLLQLDFKSLKSIELNYIWMMVILCVIIIFMITFGVVQKSRIARMNTKLTVAIAEAKAASGVPAPTKGASPKATLRDSLAQRIVWSPILNAIANNTPDTISLNYIKGASTGSRGLQIEGGSADVLASVRYEDGLAALPIFSKVFLKSSSGRESADSPGPAAGKPAVAQGAKTNAAVKNAPAGGGSDTSRSMFEIQAWLK